MRTSIVNRDLLNVAHLCLRCVSTAGQTAENEVREIEAAGFKVDPGRVITETVSGNSVLINSDRALSDCLTGWRRTMS